MAYTDKLKSTRVYIAMGDGATPETFATFCGINTKGLQQTRATSDTTDWDCAAPDAIPINQRFWPAASAAAEHHPDRIRNRRAGQLPLRL